MNPDGTVGIQNDIKGDVIDTFQVGNTKIYHVVKFCPSCPERVHQPTDHTVIYRGLNNVSYICDVCCSHYYYLQNEVFFFISEGELQHLLGYKRRVNRRPFELHYLEARECKWFDSIDLECTKVVQGTWTAVTEISAQIFHKNITGKAPGYLMCYKLSNDQEEPIPQEMGLKMQEAIGWLKTMGYM